MMLAAIGDVCLDLFGSPAVKNGAILILSFFPHLLADIFVSKTFLMNSAVPVARERQDKDLMLSHQLDLFRGCFLF